MKKIKLKKGAQIYKDDSVENMRNKKKVAKALLECIADNDLEAFREILEGHIMAMNITNFSKEVGVPRRTIYNILESDSNPTLKNVAKIISKISA
jgi:probable addiction module antidote protein